MRIGEKRYEKCHGKKKMINNVSSIKKKKVA